jgi:glyoxylase-like metal-dependent hydrolase (beta-lactamase superfamily II)
MVDIDATTLNKPLSGGSTGAVVSMRPFSTGEMGVPKGFLARVDEPLARPRAFWRALRHDFDHWTPCPVFIVEHPSAGRILIDTGLPAAVAHDIKAAVGSIAARMYGFRASEEQSLPARMRALGIPRGGIDVVVMTHLHIDHAGALGEIEDSIVVVSKDEWKSAHGSRTRARGYLRSQYELAHDFRLVDFNSDNVNSLAGFGRAFDLFGDGSVMLVHTPGHTHGHMSVVLRLKDRECLVAGDAIYTRNSLEPGTLPLVLADEHNYKRSLREIRAYMQMTPSALVIPGHDAGHFATLAERY